jgi:hypothetical protein
MSLKPLTDFLAGLGLETLCHTDKTFFSHLLGVHRLMQEAGCDEELCRAGIFHSIYGTETTQGFKLGLGRRGDVRSLIGARAERLAYLNCAMDRSSFDRAVQAGLEPHVITDRLIGEEVGLSRRDLDDLCAIHLFDWLEQVPRSWRGWDYRRDAYRRMAERVGDAARAAYDKVFAREAWGLCPPSGPPSTPTPAL